MGRYDVTFDETWTLDVSKDDGFPYNFEFVFDREDNRYVTDPDEG